MKKIFFCVSLALAGLMAACKEEVVDADSKPGWLGESIYQELRNPDPSRLTGTFDTYLRLVDDLGLAETLDRTGSKTVFLPEERLGSDKLWAALRRPEEVAALQLDAR